MEDWGDVRFIRETVEGYRASTLRWRSGDVTISQVQQATLKAAPIQGPMWASKFVSPSSPEDDARRLLCKAVDHLGGTRSAYKIPRNGSIEGYWTGSRPGVSASEPELRITEAERYARLREDAQSPVVMLFAYGGAFFMNGPSSYRKTYARLAQGTGGRVFNVNQSLAPQNPFPQALLDLFHGYLSLLAPPPGSFHEPISPSNIVLVGDSSGANLCLALLQVLLTIQREGWVETIRFHGKNVRLALPAGFTATCAMADITNSFPSQFTNAGQDIFPEKNPHVETTPSCGIWPSSPPRGNMYCEVPMMVHPLVSPAMCKDWHGAPPMWIAMGQEQQNDAAKLVAKTAFQQGVDVKFSEYELMPHSWPVVFSRSPQSKKLWKEWTETILAMQRGEKMESKAVFVRAKGLKEFPLELGSLVPLSQETAEEMMRDATKGLVPYTGKHKLTGPSL